MPEIALDPRRGVSRVKRRAGAAAGAAVGALTLAALAIVVFPLSDGSQKPYTFVAPGVTAGPQPAGETTATPRGTKRPQTGLPEGPQVAAEPSVESVALVEGEPSAPSGGSAVGPTDFPDAPTDGPIGGPTEGPVDGTNKETDSGRQRLSGLLSPTEQLLLAAIGVAAPGLAPAVGDLFDTTNGLLDTVDDGLPVKQGAAKR